MILQALNGYYERLLKRHAPGLSAFGYSPEKISHEILLAPDGRIVGVNALRDLSGKKPQPLMLSVPQPEKRTVGIKSNFLWDKTSYVLGVSATSKRADKEHEAFKSLHREVLANEDDASLRAFLAFLDQWTPDQFQPPLFEPEMLDTNFVFRIDGEMNRLHDLPAAQTARARLFGGSGDEGLRIASCLVTNKALPVARLHPPIKGVYGAQSSGASLVSFNLESFCSYGKSQGENAPISEQAAFAYSTVLNHLLRRGEHNRQRVQIGDASVVFWAEAADSDQAAAAEFLFADLLNPPAEDGPETEKLNRVLHQVKVGLALHDLDPQLADGTRMFVLGLAPNASRLSIRFWHTDTLHGFAWRLAQHAEDLHIEPSPWHGPPAAHRLVLATVPHRDGSMPKADDASSHLIGELMRSILSGIRYPHSLLANAVMRMRADGNVSGARVALCKAVLARDLRLRGGHDDETFHNKELPVSLDVNSTHPGYRLGRLFAVLENAQRAALGGQVNATIRDRYYGAASATPASVFPVLLRGVQNHLGKLRKDKPGWAVTLEKSIGDIVDGLSDRFPRSLRIEDQGRFALGYYHQNRALYAKTGSSDRTDPPNDNEEASE